MLLERKKKKKEVIHRSLPFSNLIKALCSVSLFFILKLQFPANFQARLSYSFSLVNKKVFVSLKWKVPLDGCH